ncbi:hypothetical protein HF896_05310 [Alicycliphilus denitrificans]|uniref:Uncharacterized protein n=1 Tax=Alicycliphilus denitrificans TaxID=179636 RepID=A0A858ZRF0_9BURK|nr:hypothetical protein [Alicycliphilus denitrificans]QKD43062.1 hypothetical protein HF896_05310 [Alicycliphilus denitrificans]GAO20496.1 putative transcriptional regulator [Alicycliphilus sp. B1]
MTFFKHNTHRLPGVIYDTSATLPGCVNLSVRATAELDEVEVAQATGASYIAIRVTAEQARALAHELLAAADAKGGVDA